MLFRGSLVAISLQPCRWPIPSPLSRCSGGLWYLTPERLAELRFCGLELSAGSNEALAIREPRAAEWLQLRFGGPLQSISLSSAWLMDEALELPAPAPLANVG